MRRAAAALKRRHMSAIFFTLITDDVIRFVANLRILSPFYARDDEIASLIRGYHLEGPWISKESGYRGAHPLNFVREPSLADYRRLWDAAGGRIKLITLAPEVEGCLSVIEEAASDGIRIALGHTNASEEEIDQAIAVGATLELTLEMGFRSICIGMTMSFNACWPEMN